MGKPWALRLLRSCLFFSGRMQAHQGNHPAGEPRRGGRHHRRRWRLGLPAGSEDIIFDVLARFRGGARSSPTRPSPPRSNPAPPPPLPSSSRRVRENAPYGEVFTLPGPTTTLSPGITRVIDTADGTVLRVVKDVKSTKLIRTRLGLVFVDQGEHGARVIDPSTRRVLTFSRELPDRYPTANYNRTSSILSIHNRSCHCSFGRATSSGTYKICQVATLRDGMPAEPMRR
uniref:Uncharacterized protein n=1 Tax=Setaria viridis TaxID=4556 RepID=A0A4U6WBJ8_SETVI|nr:hypothetical protein SEVIR_1G176800v2 [Setaria viridis]